MHKLKNKQTSVVGNGEVFVGKRGFYVCWALLPESIPLFHYLIFLYININQTKATLEQTCKIQIKKDVGKPVLCKSKTTLITVNVF